MKKRKHFSVFEKRGMLSSVAFGVALMGAGLLLFSMIAAFILLRISNPIGGIAKASLIILLISGGASGFLTSARGGEKGIPAALLSTLVFTLLMLAAALIFGGGHIGSRILMNALCYIGISMIFAALGKRKRRTRHRR